MATDTELTRLADMAHALRPDWHPRSIRTYLVTHMRTKAYRDLAVALAWIAADPDTTTPGRLDENGPWWAAAVASTQSPTFVAGPGSQTRCPQPGHEHEPAVGCRACRGELVAADGPPEPVNAAPPPLDRCSDCGDESRFLVAGRCYRCRSTGRGKRLEHALTTTPTERTTP